MSHAFPHLFAPIRIGPIALNNRVVMAPMTTGYGESDGTVSDRQIAYYAERARGGVGAVIVENAYTHPDAAGALRQIGACDERFRPGLTRLAKAIHDGGARALLQLCHAGSKALLPPGELPLTPSGRGTAGPGRVATAEEMEAVVAGFVAAALLAREAGFDGVELHGAHGYLGHEFSSPAYNQRTDRWGGDAAGRARVLTESARRIRQQVPQLAITVRLSVDEYTPGGLDLNVTRELVPHLLAAGVDALHASAGGGPLTRTRRPNSTGCGEATTIGLAHGLREVAGGVPVIAVGRFLTPARCEQAIRDGETDMVALGRALLADPSWADKAGRGRAADIRPCVGCQGCQFRSLVPGSKCLVNPRLGHEAAVPQAGPARRVGVVGSSFAGLAFARESAMRGDRVTIWTGGLPLGGLWALRARVPGNTEIAGALAWYADELQRLNVGVRSGQPSQADEEQAVWIDAAPGAPLPLDLAGDGPAPLDAAGILSGDVLPCPGAVAVVGGGLTAGETALCLASANRRVIVVSPAAQVGADSSPEIGERLRERLAAHGVTVLNQASASRFDGGWLQVTATGGSTLRLGPLASVVNGQGWAAPPAATLGDDYESLRAAALTDKVMPLLQKTPQDQQGF